MGTMGTYLMVGGPLDGRAMQFRHAPSVIRDPGVMGGYVFSRLSPNVAVYHWKDLEPEPSRWEKRHKKVDWAKRPAA